MQLVSILIPCYNAQRWIAQAIESALAQTWANKEIIVIDDGSTDRSLDIIEGFDVRWDTGPNRGGNAARNRLLSMANGEWLQYLDADDYLLPEKLSRQLAFLESHPSADVIYSPGWVEYDGTIGLRQIPPPRDLWVSLIREQMPQTGGPLWRKQALEDVNGWKIDQPCCQEHDLYLRLLMAGKSFAYCEDAGAVYRYWGNHTVSKRNPNEWKRRQLVIQDQAEEFLRATGQLTRIRKAAIYESRYWTGRQLACA